MSNSSARNGLNPVQILQREGRLRPYNAQMKLPINSLTRHSFTTGSFTTRSVLPILLAGSLCCGNALAQELPHPAAPANQTAQAISKAAIAPETPAETLKRCWEMLTDSVEDAKHTETRTQALNALSSLGSNPRADKLIAAAMKDPNLDVRTAAVLAAGKTKSPSLAAPIRELLNDHEPQVVFAAAETLWKQFKDKNGEDVLAAVAAGDRKANPTLIHGAQHDISRTIHSPSALAKIGITAGAGLVLGPFGFSVAAVEYMRKNGADTARVQSIELLADDRTEGVRDQMQSALDDKDPGVRAAAVMVLGGFHRSQDASKISSLLDDSKLPVRLAAAAAYIDCVSSTSRTKASR